MATRTIGTEIVLSGEKQFNDAMKGVNNNLKNLRTDMSLVSAEFEGNADSMDALTAKQKLLEQTVDQHKAKVAALSEMYKRQVELNGENSAKADTYRQQLTAATVALVKEQNALKKTTTAIEEKNAAEKAAAESAKAEAEAAKKAEEEAKKKRKTVKELVQAYRSMVEKLAEVKENQDQFAEKTKKATELVGKYAKVVTAVPTAAGKAAVGMTKMTAAAAAGAYALGVTGVTALIGFAKESEEFAGQLENFNAATGNAKNALGQLLLPALNDLSTKGADFLNSFAADMEAAAGDTEAQTQIMADYIVKGVELIREELPKYLQMGKDLILSLGEGLADAGAVDEVLGFVEDLIGDLLSTVVQLAPRLAQGGVELVGKLGMSLVENAPLLLQGGLELILGILQGLTTGLSDIYNSGPEIIETLKESFAQSKEIIKDIGGDIIDLIWDGITDAWDNFTDWFNDLWDGLFENRNIDVNVNGGGSGSPQNSGLSYVPYNGFLAQLHQGEMVLTREQAAAYRRGLGGGKSVSVNIYTQQLSEGDINMVVDIVNRKLGDDL